MKLTLEVSTGPADQLRLTVLAGTDATSLDPASETEISRRMKQIDSGEVVCRPWAEVMSELRVKHG